jgi:alpha-beta hydrolase superfamily lysophospholipase
MISSSFTLNDAEGVEVFVRRFEPDSGAAKAVVQIAHGVGEHSGRYAWTAERFCAAGYACYADDHRGHGKTADATGGLGRLGPGGWDACVRDLALVSDRANADHPGLPLFLLGHSWGSHLAQDYVQRWGARLAGVVLTGSTGRLPFIVTGIGPIFSRILVLLLGPETPSSLADKLVFEGYNKPYEPSPTNSKADWTSRDPEEIRGIVDDPLCNAPQSTLMSLEISLAYKRIWREENEARIPRTLPVLIMSGTEDATNAHLADLKPLAERYRNKYGIVDVTEKYYEGARHCVLHETNKEEVTADCLAWLDARYAGTANRASP